MIHWSPPKLSIPTNHPFPFDPTYGFTLDQLRAVTPPPPPPTFAAIWEGRHSAALATDPNPKLTASATTHPDWLIHDITYSSTEGFQIGGWLLLPRDAPIRRGLVVGHGYGGRDQPDLDLPVTETAILFPCFRGLSRSARPPISTDPAWHVLHDIDKPDHYILAGCVADLWLAVSTLIALYPRLDGHIGYSGISFGGGIGALAVPFDRRIDRVHLVVPTFGNMPLWLTLPTTGSAHAVQAYRAGHPDVIDTLRFYDSASAATLIAIPTLIAVARFDPAVAPPCQFSVANALPASNHHETFVLDAGHFDYPDTQRQHTLLSEKVRTFFRAT